MNGHTRLAGPVQAAVIAALLGISVLIGTLFLRNPSPPERLVTKRPIQVEADGYVSSQACGSCHPSQYESWHGSFHRTMTQVATPETVRADFDGVTVNEVQDKPIHLERRGDEFWADFDDPDSIGGSGLPRRIERQIVMITGSHQQQVYWYRSDDSRLLGQLPGTYLIADKEWIPRRAAFMRPPNDHAGSETGRWNAVCINCHATHGKSKFDAPFGSGPVDTQVADTTVSEFGIACEACHGPSEAHVRANRNPLRRYELHLTGLPDPTTVLPVRVDPKVSSQICGQCHGVWEFYDRAAEQRANAAGFAYRPGQELRATRFVVQPPDNSDSPVMKKFLAEYPPYLQDSFWSDGMIRVSGREYNGLIQSPCFKNARDPDRTLSCFSCHTMHKPQEDPRSIAVWADSHQVSAGKEGNEACLQCHQDIRANISAHTKHSLDSSGSSCYNCHMPYTTYGLMRSLRSHQISSPTVAASLQTGRPNACNLCHLDKTLKWTADHLQEWYGTPRVPLDHDEQTVSSSLLWLLRGDAGQRGLVAWSMGWQPAQQASGADWMAPYLAVLLDDPYEAVRFIANRSLHSLPGFGEFRYDFLAPETQRTGDGSRAMELWRGTLIPGRARTGSELLLSTQGSLDINKVVTLLRQRDDHRVNLRE